MSDMVSGITVKKIDESVSNIYNCAEKINSLFNQFDNLIESTKGFYNCPNAVEYRKRYETIRQNFFIVNNNILKYSEKLLSVKDNYNKAYSNVNDFIAEQNKKEGNEII